MKNHDSSAPADTAECRTMTHPRRDSDIGSSLTFASVEYVHLRARSVALESLVTSLLSQLSDSQRDGARQHAHSILPRTGATKHQITTDAVQQINHLVDRSEEITGKAQNTPARA